MQAAERSHGPRRDPHGGPSALILAEREGGRRGLSRESRHAWKLPGHAAATRAPTHAWASMLTRTFNGVERHKYLVSDWGAQAPLCLLIVPFLFLSAECHFLLLLRPSQVLPVSPILLPACSLHP